eukprot:s3416_g5.t1
MSLHLNEKVVDALPLLDLKLSHVLLQWTVELVLGQDGVSHADSDPEVIDWEFGEVEVKLNLYNLPWLCGANHVLEPFGYGAYHVAVQVLDREWWFDLQRDPLHPCSGIWVGPFPSWVPAKAVTFADDSAGWGSDLVVLGEAVVAVVAVDVTMVVARMQMRSDVGDAARECIASVPEHVSVETVLAGDGDKEIVSDSCEFHSFAGLRIEVRRPSEVKDKECFRYLVLRLGVYMVVAYDDEDDPRLLMKPQETESEHRAGLSQMTRLLRFELETMAEWLEPPQQMLIAAVL